MPKIVLNVVTQCFVLSGDIRAQKKLCLFLFLWSSWNVPLPAGPVREIFAVGHSILFYWKGNLKGTNKVCIILFKDILELILPVFLVFLFLVSEVGNQMFLRCSEVGASDTVKCFMIFLMTYNFPMVLSKEIHLLSFSCGLLQVLLHLKLWVSFRVPSAHLGSPLDG